MATTLTQETQRATDERFLVLVRAAIFRELPNVIGEAIGAPNAPTLAALTKRHAWAMQTLNAQNGAVAEVARAAAMLAGEPAIRAVDTILPDGRLALPADNVVTVRNAALINDYAGVTAADLV